MKALSRRIRAAIVTAAAIAVGPLVSSALAGTYATNASGGGQVTSSSNGSAATYLDIMGGGNGPGAGTAIPEWCYLNFNSGSLGIAPGNTVSGVGATLTVDLFNSPFYGSSPTDFPLHFYMVTDTTTASTLRYDTASNPSGLAALGSSKSFSAGSQKYDLGTGVYSNGLSAGNNTTGYDFTYNLTLPSAAQSYLANQVQLGGTVRLAIVADAASAVTNDSYQDLLGAAFGGYGNTTTGVPQITLDVSTTSAGSNASTLYLTTPGNKTVSKNFGRVIKGQAATMSLTLGNSGSSATTYHITSGTGSGGTVAAAGTVTVVGGFAAADTNVAAGTDLAGSTHYQNFSNAGDADAVLNSSAHVVEVRYLNAGGAGTATSALGPNDLGKILVGATKTQALSATNGFQTTNTDTGGDLSVNMMPNLAMKANAAFASFAFKDKVTANTLANVSGAGATTDQVFSGDVNGNSTVNGSIGQGAGSATIQAIKSGVVNGTSAAAGSSGAPYASLASSTGNLVGEGLAGESETARMYLAWTGVAAASLSSNNTTALSPGGTATITNAIANDNGANSIRASARLTGVSFNQSGWSQNGLNASNTPGSGTVIASTTTAGGSASATVSFDPSNKINGTYSANMAVTAENDDQYNAATNTGTYGTSHNDLPTQNFPLAATVNSPTGSGAGSYSLNGGTLSAGATNLTGSFTQTGGTATFQQITGSGTVSVANSATLALAANGSATVSTVANLTLNTGGKVDLNGNGLAIASNFNGAPATAAAVQASGNVISTAVALNPTQMAVAYGTGADVGGNFMGQSVPGSSVIARATWIGDANFDGVVDRNDVRAMNSAGLYGTSTTGATWAQGDFNGDGVVDRNDIRALNSAGQYNVGVPAVVSGAKMLTSKLAVVAQPASATLGGLGDGKPDFVYNPATGNVTFTYDGAAANATELDLVSGGSKFIVGNVASGVTGSFGFASAGEIDCLNVTAYADNTDLGNILPANLTQTQLLNDLSLTIYLKGGSASGQAADVIVAAVPEPGTLGVLALGLLGVLARRRRRSA